MLVLVLSTNISYATTEITENINKSLEKMFTNDLKLKENSSGETITIKGQEVQIQENQIKILDTNNKQEFNIKYGIQNNMCKFKSDIPMQLSEHLTEEELTKKLAPIMHQLGNYDICYLAVADALGVDLSLAYTYYVQNYNNELIDTENKIYSITTNLQELRDNATAVDKITIELQVNCLELMKLNSSDIDNTNTYTVTVIEKEETKPPIDEGEDDEPQPQPQPQPNEDQTAIKQEIPKAGLNKIFGITISVITIFSIIMYRKNIKYKGII